MAEFKIFSSNLLKILKKSYHLLSEFLIRLIEKQSFIYCFFEGVIDFLIFAIIFNKSNEKRLSGINVQWEQSILQRQHLK